MEHQFIHVPVLLREVIEHLKPEPKTVFIDGTVGLGGHSKALMERVLPLGRLLAIDRDPRNLDIAKETLVDYTDAVIFVCDSFANMKQHAYDQQLTQVNGILLDLGFSSAHIEDASRGFSFLAEGLLDMRYDPDQSLTAQEIVNKWSEDDLAEIFRKYGEEKQARKIAQALIRQRKHHPFTTTIELAEYIEAIIPRRGKVHPATKVFQALRIAVNDELGELERVLPDAVELLAPGGRLAIISFHSLEDRIVKHFFKKHPELTVVTKKPVAPSEREIKQNPRARSAKLRVAEKL